MPQSQLLGRFLHHGSSPPPVPAEAVCSPYVMHPVTGEALRQSLIKGLSAAFWVQKSDHPQISLRVVANAALGNGVSYHISRGVDAGVTLTVFPSIHGDFGPVLLSRGTGIGNGGAV